MNNIRYNSLYLFIFIHFICSLSQYNAFLINLKKKVIDTLRGTDNT